MTLAGSQPDLCIWTGPVWEAILNPVEWLHPTKVLTLPCKGSDGCAALAASLPRSGLLRALLNQHKLDPEQFRKIMLAGFSAGHGLNELILADPESNARVSALCSADSYYTGKVPGIKPGHDAFAARAVEGTAVMWTSSSKFPGAGYVSCEDAIQPLLAKYALERTELPGDIADRVLSPVYCASRGSWYHAHFGDRYQHGQHATVVAPAALSGWIDPTLNVLPSPGTLAKLAAALGGAAAVAGVFFGARWLWRRR